MIEVTDKPIPNPEILDSIKAEMYEFEKNDVKTMRAQIAEFERELTRERTKLAHERAKKEGRHWGRPKGKKDSKTRCKSGYYQRWSKQGKKVTP